MAKKKNSYVTLVSSDYIRGVIALDKSLKKVDSEVELLVMYWDLSDDDIKYLKSNGIKLIKVNRIESKKSSGRYVDTYNKLNIWNLNIEKVIFLDSDCVVLKNIDHLFDIDCEFAACEDNGVELGRSLFNTGVMLIKPNKKIFKDMLSKIDVYPSYDGSDQGFLNAYFPFFDNIVLEQKYNVLKRIFRHHRELWKTIDVHVLHFVGRKPWEDDNEDRDYRELNLLWKDIYFG
jgi:lipopolysaccharide biosynthesis glycosyltransferase